MKPSEFYIFSIKYIIPAVFFIFFTFVFVNYLMIIVSVIWIFASIFISILNLPESARNEI